METPKDDSSKLTTDSETASDNSKEKGEEVKKDRRLQDGIVSKDPNRKLNLDRRVTHNDRRFDLDPNYKGPSRRYTIDRRLNTKDRRDKGSD